MSRRRSAIATLAVLSVFAFLYSLVLVIPVHVGDVSALWSSRGHGWFGDVLGRMIDGFRFLWGSAVMVEGYPVAPASGWPTVVFVALLAGLVYASLWTGSEGAFAVAGRVLCASVLAGGLTNLFVVVQTVRGIRGGLESLPTVVWALPGDGIWLGLVVGVFGGYAAYAASAFATVAAIALRGDGGTGDSVTAAEAPETALKTSAGRARAARIATWGSLPTLVLALVGGFVWDYGPDADPYGAEVSPRQAWVRLVWFAHATLSAPNDPYALGGSFETSIWLPRAVTSAVLVVLVWLAIYLVVARWPPEGGPGAFGIVVQCWGLVAVLAAAVGLLEGAFFQQAEFAGSALYWALETAADGVRFAACFGWLTGVAVVLAHRLSRGVQTDGEAVEAAKTIEAAEAEVG
ncbi:hypothetical protein [Nocardioides sp. NPDC006273]|uniref:hypothetical protein n=1 Tax=Nocardioides sp. NPDC006273 TaxID=3155598 RepID=UPI0033AB5F93